MTIAEVEPLIRKHVFQAIKLHFVNLSDVLNSHLMHNKQSLDELLFVSNLKENTTVGGQSTENSF